MRAELGSIMPAAIVLEGHSLRYDCPDTRRQDWLMAVAFALLLHGGILFEDRLFPRPRSAAPVKAPEEKVIQMEMPPIEPEKPEEVVELQEASSAEQLAPPALADVPHVVPIDAFTQPLAPPPPPGIRVGQGTLTIPVGKPGAGFGKGLQNLFSIDNLDQRPVLKAPLPPDYPYEMRKQGIRGAVDVEFIIDYKGDVIAVQVISSTNPAFEMPALRAVERWKFRPGRKGGRAVNTRAQQTITFNLDDR